MTVFQVLDRADRPGAAPVADPDPLAVLATAGLGWLVEHVAFLRGPLDWLAGHDDVLEDAAVVWRQAGTTLGGIAWQRAWAVGVVGPAEAGPVEAGPVGIGQVEVGPVGTGWEQWAAEVFRGRLTGEIAAMSRVCAGVARQVAVARAIVADVRGVLRDVIALFVSEVMANATVALASAEVSHGASVAEFATWAVGRGAVVLGRMGARLLELARLLVQVMSGLKALFGMVGDMLDALTRSGGEHQGATGPRRRTFRRRTGHLDE